MAEGEFVRRLGEAGYSPNNARGELLDLLACAGFLVHEGLVLTAICETLIELNARAVIVLSADFARGGLRTIPEVKDAVRDA